MKTLLRSCVVLLLVGCTVAIAATDPFVGRWALTLPDSGAGWFGISQGPEGLRTEALWGSGSVRPVARTSIEGDRLVITRILPGRNATAQSAATATVTEIYTATLQGDVMHGTRKRVVADGSPASEVSFNGRRIADLPPTPDLAHVRFGAPVSLFNGRDLTGWRLTDARRANGWSVADGVLMNRPTQIEGRPHRFYGNLRTDAVFEDFNLQLEVRTQPGSNSGIYLRGIYEVQVSESYGQKPDSHNMGALYSRITPAVAAEKPPGEWQTFDITLVDRHLTVVLNGTRIIDNQPILGVTGGALTADEFKPGPIYLQGDHTSIDYRNIVLRPVVK
jgi:hypothetical protein